MTTYYVATQTYSNYNPKYNNNADEFTTYEEAKRRYEQEVARLQHTDYTHFPYGDRVDFLKNGENIEYEVTLGHQDDEDCDFEVDESFTMKLADRYEAMKEYEDYLKGDK